MKKVLILANNDGGLYNFRRELVEKLVKEYEVYICVPEGKRIPFFKELGCQFVPISFDRHGTNPFSEIKLLKTYKDIIKKVNPDIVFTYTIKPNVYGGMACANLGIPYVANITGLGTAVENGGIMQIITLYLYKIGLRKAQKVFFQNTENRDFMLSKGVITGHYELLPGSGVNLGGYKLLDYPDGEEVHFVFIARIMKEKGIDQYLEAAKHIRAKYPQTRFHVCGRCEQRYEEILEQFQKEEIIIYHGRVDDIAAMHKISSCTIHPSYYAEGMSNVLLESCACGRPIITTNRAGCRDVVDDGVNGYIVQQKDAHDLIEKIEKFLQLSIDERKKMGVAGRKKVEQQFDRNIVIEKYVGEIK